jgi:hypothetical protein
MFTLSFVLSNGICDVFFYVFPKPFKPSNHKEFLPKGKGNDLLSITLLYHPWGRFSMFKE